MEAASAARNSSPPLILAVDDDDFMLMMLEDALIDHYRVITASSGEAALKAAEEMRPDLILLDIEMPGLGGYETCRRIKGNGALAHIPVIFVTGHEDEAAHREGLAAGGSGIVIKPFVPDDILEVVTTVLPQDSAQ